MICGIHSYSAGDFFVCDILVTWRCLRNFNLISLHARSTGVCCNFAWFAGFGWPFLFAGQANGPRLLCIKFERLYGLTECHIHWVLVRVSHPWWITVAALDLGVLSRRQVVWPIGNVYLLWFLTLVPIVPLLRRTDQSRREDRFEKSLKLPDLMYRFIDIYIFGHTYPIHFAGRMNQSSLIIAPEQSP